MCERYHKITAMLFEQHCPIPGEDTSEQLQREQPRHSRDKKISSLRLQSWSKAKNKTMSSRTRAVNQRTEKVCNLIAVSMTGNAVSIPPPNAPGL